MSVGVGGLLSISAVKGGGPCVSISIGTLPPPPIVIIASGLRPACSGAQSATPAVNYS